MDSGKCAHELLIVHGDGVWFRAECAACGLSGPQADSPGAARAKFNRRRGRQPKRRAPVWLHAAREEG